MAIGAAKPPVFLLQARGAAIITRRGSIRYYRWRQQFLQSCLRRIGEPLEEDRTC
jgi:hypothetical protein